MPNYQKHQLSEMEVANELQDTANDLQQELIAEMKANNEATSKHNTAIKWLTIAIVVVGVLTIWSNYNQTGRYAIWGNTTQGTTYVLDTKTSQLWGRSLAGNIYLGTNENPESKAYPLNSTTKSKTANQKK